MIAIIDYGMGNIHSVQKALESLGAQTTVVADPQGFGPCEKIVLPGVGAFDDAMQALVARRLVPAIHAGLAQKKPFLGICLGMQLLFDTSEEAPGVKGLGIVSGTVVRFQNRPGFKVPHMGWNQLQKVSQACPLLAGISNGAFVYFCHSYYVVPRNPAVQVALTSYAQAFSAVIQQGEIFGMQFHPEKSQDVGMSMLKNFVAL